jgi:hypothetical protein
VPLRIAFDLDGVFADMEGELSRRAEALFGSSDGDRTSQEPESSVDRPDPDAATAGDDPLRSRTQVALRQQQSLWEHVESIENFWETLTEIEPGSVARLAALAAERDWEIIFLTRRPASAGATSQVQSQRWLKARGFALPSVFVVQGSRGRIAAALGLDFVIDDTPENCLDVVLDSRARAILVWRDERQEPPGSARLGIQVVASVEECLNFLARIDVPSRRNRGVLGRVKRLLGLKAAGA